MKTPWVIGIVAGAHVMAIAGIMVIQGCGTTQGTLPPPGAAIMPPSPVVDEPPPPPPVAPPVVKAWPPATTSEYVVKPGESLSKIAARFGLSTRELAALNGIENPSLIRVGQKLMLPGKQDVGQPAPASAPAAAPAKAPVKAPAKATVVSSGNAYIVKSGDSLSKIAAAHGCSTKALMDVNNLTGPKIIVGQKLAIPGSSSTAAAAPKAPVAATAAPVVKPAATQPTATQPAPLSLDGAPIELPSPAMDAMPPSSMREHIVGEDEDLPRIAMTYGVTVTRLKEVNHLLDGEVQPGQKVMIPISE